MATITTEFGTLNARLAEALVHGRNRVKWNGVVSSEGKQCVVEVVLYLSEAGTIKNIIECLDDGVSEVTD